MVEEQMKGRSASFTRPVCCDLSEAYYIPRLRNIYRSYVCTASTERERNFKARDEGTPRNRK